MAFAAVEINIDSLISVSTNRSRMRATLWAMARGAKKTDLAALNSESVPGLGQVMSAPTKLKKNKVSSESAPMGSLGIFNSCIDRAENLLKIHKAAHGRKAKPEKYLADAHRAAIVLSISALDAFVRSFVIDRIRRLVGDRTIVLPPPLADRIRSFLKEDGLLEAARKGDLLDRVEKAFRNDFETRSFQGVRQIREGLKLVGFDDIFHDVAIQAGLNEDTLCANLEQFTKRRHTIAHRGDYDLNVNPPSELTVTKKDAEECISVVKSIALAVDRLGKSS